MVREQLSIEEKRAIIREVQVEGKSISSVARDYGRSRKTIRNIVNKATSGYCNIERRGKLSEPSKQLIRRMIKENPLLTLEHLSDTVEREGGSHVSRYTISRFIAREGYRAVKKKKHRTHKRGKNRTVQC